MNVDDQYNLKFGGNAGAHVDAYWEYNRIVGKDDGGQTFTPEQFEAYKERVRPMRFNNRLYVSWQNTEGMDCKLIGPETPCLCTHRYVDHNSDFATIPTKRPIKLPCTAGCGCTSFYYEPKLGNQMPRCQCKHFHDDHNIAKPPFKCAKDRCGCAGYSSTVRCGCGEKAIEHVMHVETKAERLAAGKPVGQDVMYKGMGGITGFSSLMDGYMRLDDSGIGAPTEEFLNQPITSMDNPFLRAHARTLQALGASGCDEEVASATRREGETDMDYFERRYQERQRAAKQGSRAVPLPARRSIQGRQPPPQQQGTGRAVAGAPPRLSIQGRPPQQQQQLQQQESDGAVAGASGMQVTGRSTPKANPNGKPKGKPKAKPLPEWVD